MSTFVPRLSAWVELPASGYKVFELAREPPAAENYRDSIAFSNSGFGISSLRAEDGTELLSGSLGLVAISDTSDTWAHGINSREVPSGFHHLLSAIRSQR
jgi:alpha-mannosidase